MNFGVVCVSNPRFVSGDFSMRRASTASKGTVVMEPNKHGIHMGN